MFIAKRIDYMRLLGGIGCSFWLTVLVITGAVHAGEPGTIEIVKTSPAYGEEVLNQDLVITIEFNQEMDYKMQEDFVLDQRGATDESGNPIEIKGQFSWPSPKILQFKPHKALKSHSTYQVSLFSVRTRQGKEMESVPFRLVFTTK
jgi:hypothetical protein